MAMPFVKDRNSRNGHLVSVFRMFVFWKAKRGLVVKRHGRVGGYVAPARVITVGGGTQTRDIRQRRKYLETACLKVGVSDNSVPSLTKFVAVVCLWLKPIGHPTILFTAVSETFDLIGCRCLLSPQKQPRRPADVSVSGRFCCRNPLKLAATRDLPALR